VFDGGDTVIAALFQPSEIMAGGHETIGIAFGYGQSNGFIENLNENILGREHGGLSMRRAQELAACETLDG
jgi:hypothetical protein